jgi:nitric oxide reductase NorQ protein
MDRKEAIRAAIIEPLTDDPDVKTALTEVVNGLIA